MNINDFIRENCQHCHKECVRKKDIKECMRAYKDFVRHSRNTKLRGFIDYKLLLCVVGLIVVYILFVNLLYDYAIQSILSISVGM